MKRKISREVIYRQLKSQGKRLKAMSISLGSVSVVEKSTVLSFLFNFVSDHTSPTPTLCPKWELSVNVALGKGQVDSFPETCTDHYGFLGSCPPTPPLSLSISLGSVSVVEKSTVLSFLFNFVSDHTSPTPTLCPKWELSVNVALGKGQVDSFPETCTDHYGFLGSCPPTPPLSLLSQQFALSEK